MKPPIDNTYTTGAIYGKFAGVYYGAKEILTQWRSKVT
jgi:ADP-ribosylglycohydrolase